MPYVGIDEESAEYVENPLNPLAAQLYAALSYQLIGVATVALLIYFAYSWRSNVASSESRRVDSEEQAVRTQEPPGRRIIRLGLGLLWIFDGLLQAQPAMPSNFVKSVVEPVAQGQPSWMRALISISAAVWQGHPVKVDSATVWIQLAIGLLLLAGGTAGWSRLGALFSVGWGMVIWINGEALGTMLVPGATALTGAPGSALIYAILGAVVLWPLSSWEAGRARIWLTRGLGVFWLSMALLQALPFEHFWHGKGLVQALGPSQKALRGSGTSALALSATRFLGSNPEISNGVLVAIMAIIGVAWLRGDKSRWTLILTSSWLALTWWLGMGFGFLGGTGTDPNTAAPLALIVAAASCRLSAYSKPRALADSKARFGLNTLALNQFGFRVRSTWQPAGVAVGFAGLVMATVLMAVPVSSAAHLLSVSAPIVR